MPEMIPVANQVQPPDPSKGMGLLSGIIGIQQQKQNLQTGAFQQETAQAEATQAQQRSRELQAAQQLVINGSKSGQYDDGQGGVDRQKLANDILSVAPTYGQPVMSSLLSQANEIVANKQAHQNLTVSRKQEMGATFASLAADPQLDNTKFIDAIETLRQQHKDDPEFSRMLTSMSMHMPGNAGTDDLRALAGRWSAAATGSPQSAPSQIDTGSQIQPGATNRFTGGFTPAGTGSIPKTLAPAQQPSYLAQTGNVPEDVQRYSDISKSAQNGRTMVALSQQVASLADQVRTGQLSKEWADRLTVLQQKDPTLTSRQMLSKYSAQLKTMAEAGASTDAERSTIESGMPNPESMGPDALKEAARYMGGIGSMRLDRNRVAAAYVGQHGTNGMRAVDAQFTQNADPFIYMYRGMPAGQERQQFLLKRFGDGKKITDPQGLQQFINQTHVVKANGG